jgi:hypothetical protein
MSIQKGLGPIYVLPKMDAYFFLFGHHIVDT